MGGQVLAFSGQDNVNIKFANHKKSSPLSLHKMWLIKRCDTTHHHLTSGPFQGQCFKGSSTVNKKGKRAHYMKSVPPLWNGRGKKPSSRRQNSESIRTTPIFRRETLGGGVEWKEHGLWTKNLSSDNSRIKLNRCSKVPNGMLAINNNDNN